MSRGRRHTPKRRLEAVELAVEIGVRAASAQLSIPYGTVNNWAYIARKQAKAADQHRAEGGAPPPPVKAIEPAKATVSPAVLIEAAPDTPKAKSAKVARIYTPSEKAQALELAAAEGVSKAHEKLGMSRHSIYQWRRKVKLAAEGKGDCPTSGPDPADIEAQRDKEILDIWKLHPGLGPSQIRNQLRRKGVKVAIGTVRNVMEDNGYRPPKIRRDEHNKRFEAVRPNHMWHLDFVHKHINRTNTFTLIFIDDYSRFVVGHGVDDAERADMVIDAFSAAVERYGRPESVMHDKGSAFWSWKGISRFTKLLVELGIDQIVAEHKEWNGKVEVFNGNLAKELFNVQHFYDISEMKRRLAAHLHWYNHRRTHHALGGLLVPADRYYGRVKEVMDRIEAGAGGTAHTDMLDLRERTLELFKVVSRDGKPEIWLMGQPLLTLPSR